MRESDDLSQLDKYNCWSPPSDADEFSVNEAQICMINKNKN